MASARETIKEMSLAEAIFALGFVALMVGLMYAVMAGTIANAISLGIVILLGVATVFLGTHLERGGVLSRPALIMFYTGALGLALIFYGLIKKGIIPIAVAYEAGIEDIAITNSLLYALALVGVVVIVYTLYKFAREELKRF